jgi:hypothetical protein
MMATITTAKRTRRPRAVSVPPGKIPIAEAYKEAQQAGTIINYRDFRSLVGMRLIDGSEKIGGRLYMDAKKWSNRSATWMTDAQDAFRAQDKAARDRRRRFGYQTPARSPMMRGRANRYVVRNVDQYRREPTPWQLMAFDEIMGMLQVAASDEVTITVEGAGKKFVLTQTLKELHARIPDALERHPEAHIDGVNC